MSGEQKLTDGQIDALHNISAERAYNQIKKEVPNIVELPKQAQEVLTEMVYQMGSLSGWDGLKRAVAAKDWNKAADEVLLNSKGTGPSELADKTPNRANDYANAFRSLAEQLQPNTQTKPPYKPGTPTLNLEKKKQPAKSDIKTNQSVTQSTKKPTTTTQSVKSTISPKAKVTNVQPTEEPSILDNIVDKVNTAINVVSGLTSSDDRVAEDTKGYIKNKLLKEGVIQEETEVIKHKVDNTVINNVNIPFQKLATVKSKDYPDDNYMSYRRQASNSEGLRYIPVPRKEKWPGFKKFDKLDKMGYELGSGGNYITKNVEGVAHFLIDADISGDSKAQFKNTKSSVESLKKDPTKWLPVYKKEKDGSVIVKYTQGLKEFEKLQKEGYDDFANLRQLKVSDIDWNSEKRPQGFGPDVRNLVDKSGKDTFILFRPTGNNKWKSTKEYKGKDAMGKFEGNSLVIIFKDKSGEAIIREYAGSLNGIMEELKNIKSTYKVTDKDITLGFYDAGSYSAKPESKNGILSSKSYSQFNDQAVSGAALAIPLNKSQGRK